jgi:N-methylhydantoinase A
VTMGTEPGTTGERPVKALKGHRKVFMPEAGTFVNCPIYDRYALRGGAKLRGPAVIEEHESTVVLGPDAVVEVDKSCNLWVSLDDRKLKRHRRR